MQTNPETWETCVPFAICLSSKGAKHVQVHSTLAGPLLVHGAGFEGKNDLFL